MELILFLIMVGIISLSGVLMPGPVFAATIAKGAESKHAGAWITLGHLLVEGPLIIAIAIGLQYFFTHSLIKIAISLAGGILLGYMGSRMFLMRGNPAVVEQAIPTNPVFAGSITTGSNPYFILWWATIGASLIFIALDFGFVGILAFIIVHEACDMGWNYLVSYTVYSSKTLWNQKVHALVFGACGLFLIFFGIYFVLAIWIA
ncbi:MAG: LysE family transporter [Candidatus Heimdallarchaeota archaeon]